MKVAVAGTIQAAVGIESLAQGIGGRQAILGTIDGKDRQALPGVVGGFGPQLISEPHGLVMHLFERVPRQLGACFGDGAAMHRCRVGTKPTAASLAEKGSGLAVNTLVLAAGHQ